LQGTNSFTRGVRAIRRCALKQRASALCFSFQKRRRLRFCRAAGALNPRRAQLPALDLSRIRSRPGHVEAPAARPGHPEGRRAGRSCRPSLYPATWPDVPRISGSSPDRSSQGRRRCRCPRSGPGAAARAGSLPDQEQAPAHAGTAAPLPGHPKGPQRLDKTIQR